MKLPRAIRLPTITLTMWDSSTSLFWFAFWGMVTGRTFANSRSLPAWSSTFHLRGLWGDSPGERSGWAGDKGRFPGFRRPIVSLLNVVEAC